MKHLLITTLALLWAASALPAQPAGALPGREGPGVPAARGPAPGGTAALPDEAPALRRLSLYSSGVGFFEFQGTPAPGQTGFTLAVKLSAVDDALK
ncbi:MAG: hypothetical protein LBQ35_00910, partial [Spirochaetaceae bacterium]|nr:hypothetical protein [Spirochaetaceae bacterium]